MKKGCKTTLMTTYSLTRQIFTVKFAIFFKSSFQWGRQQLCNSLRKCNRIYMCPSKPPHLHIYIYIYFIYIVEVSLFGLPAHYGFHTVKMCYQNICYKCRLEIYYYYNTRGIVYCAKVQYAIYFIYISL